MRVSLKAIGSGLLAVAALAAAACSQQESSDNHVRAQETPANAAPVTDAAPDPEPAATPAAATAAPVQTASADAARGERRCGWLSNPTPGNWWLTDRDGQWILGTQGGEQAPGMDEMPDMSGSGWVETNGSYGYGCACMTIAHDPATRRVTRVANAQPRPIAQCRADKSLPRPE
jgi:hypothetical protein